MSLKASSIDVIQESIYTTMKQTEREEVSGDMRAQWHLGKKKKPRSPWRHTSCEYSLPFLEFFLCVQARRIRAFSSVPRSDDARAFLLRHHRAALPPSLVRQPVSFRPALPFDIFLGISTSVLRPSRSILVSLGFPCASATDQGRHLGVWCVQSERTTHRRRKLRHLRVIDVIY